MADTNMQEHDDAIAVIGMAGRFPGARTVGEFWSNLCRGVEGIVALSDAPTIPGSGQHVKVVAAPEDIDRFDAEYFQFTPRLAEIHDPQQRLLLEVAEEALQDSGYVASALSGDTGVFVGVGSSGYAREHLYANAQVLASVGAHQIYLATEKDFAPVLVAYKLGLTGPAIAINCGCSSSLVSIHLAATSLLERECDLALAGGVSISADPYSGYLYREGGILSPDGHCRSFDAAAAGTVPASAVGIVVLKRLADALRDGDHIEAVILGSAINNDGSGKIGFTAPSVHGQARVVASALAAAAVSPRDIGYIETHGTGTRLGDPIEVAALKEVFGGLPRGSCHLGAVKSNIGHSNAASGVVGFIKAALIVKHGHIPPTLHFRTPNPELGLDGSPFVVNSVLQPWRQDNGVRRAGVSSFGIGGTNAHVVMEQAPVMQSLPSARQWYVLPLSAKHPESLVESRARLAQSLSANADMNLADVAFTLQTGRGQYRHRSALVARSVEEAVTQLCAPHAQTAACTERLPAILLFPGQGAQYLGMTAGLYQQEPEFRTHIDRCAELLAPVLAHDIRRWITPAAGADLGAEALEDTLLAQPLIFATSYALARLVESYGVEIAGMLGHSLGEYVAACLADVFSLEQALGLIVQRAQLMQSTRHGSMLAVAASEQEACEWAVGCDIAALNGLDTTVLSGEREVIARVQDVLVREGRECRLLNVTRGFHSRLMDPVCASLIECVAKLQLRPPQRPYISNVTGTWIEANQATDPEYWAQHLRAPVRFADGLSTVLRENVALIECGPGRVLSNLARRHPQAQQARAIVSLCRAPQDVTDDAKCFALGLAQLWSAGVDLDLSLAWRGERRRRISLPTYAFRRQRYWVERPVAVAAQPTPELTWVRAPLHSESSIDTAAIAADLQQRLDARIESATRDADVDVNRVLETLCVEYVVSSLKQLGMSFEVGHSFSSNDLATALRIHPRQHRQFRRLLEILAQARILSAGDGCWHVLRDPGHCAPSLGMGQLIARCPSLDFQLRRCDLLWSSMATYLTGEAEMREALLADDAVSGTSKFYAEPPEKRLVNELIARAVAAVVQRIGPGRRLRILEIGAGTGGTTAGVLETLPEGAAEYCFTDKSRFFFAAARKRFAAHPITYAVLDIENDPARQDFEPNSYDVVIAANVLHATLDLCESLAHARKLLRAGGVLLILEATRRLHSTDLTYGFLEEWWSFRDCALRGDHPLASAAAWESALRQTGFVAQPPIMPADDRVPFQHAIFVSQATTEVQDASTFVFAPSLASGRRYETLLRGRPCKVIAVGAADVDHEVRQIQENARSHIPQVVYAWPLALHTDLGVRDLDQWLQEIRRSLGAIGAGAGVLPKATLRVVTRGAQASGDPSVLGLAQASIAAELRKLADRYPTISWQHIDLDDDPTQDEERIVAELAAPALVSAVSYRNGARWIQSNVPAQAQTELKNSATLQSHVALEKTAHAADAGDQEVHDTTTRAVMSVWRDVLGVAQLDPSNDFFSLGGDSLTAMQLVSRLRDKFQVEIRVRQFLEQPTIRAVVQTIEQIRTRVERATPAMATHERGADLEPTSLEQQRLLFLESTAKHLSTLFSIPIALRIQGGVDVPRLRRAFESMWQRHDTLRARFSIIDGIPWQRIEEHARPSLEIIEATGWDAAKQIAVLEEEAARPFDLAEGPLLRVKILRLHAAEHVLFVNIHHVVADSWSIGVLGSELSALYNGMPLPNLPVQYRDYVRWQQAFMAGEERAAQLRFWQQDLAGAPMTQTLPADRPRPAVPTHRGAVQTFALASELSAQLRALAHDSGSTLFVTLLGIFSVLVHAEIEAEEVLVGTDVANRPRSQFEPLIGFFINVIALRISLRDNPDVIELLARTRRVGYEAYANQSVPFDQVVASIKDSRRAGYAPLLQMKFLMQNAPASAMQLGEARVSSVPLRRAASELDVIFSMRDTSAGVQALIEYNTDLFDALTVRRFADEYVWLAERCVSDTGSRLSAIVADLRRWQAARRVETPALRAVPGITRARKVLRAE